MDLTTSSCLPIAIEDLLYLRRVEAARVEFKAGWNEGPTARQVLRTICALANDFYNVNGGYIVLGVEERAGVAQLPPRGLDPAEIEAAQRWIRGNCRRLQPEVQPILSPEVVGDRHLLVVWVPGSLGRPHSTPGERAGERRFWVRLGTDTVEAQGPILTQLMQMTHWVPFDDREAPRFTPGHLRATLVREFLQEVGSALIDEPGDDVLYRAMQLVTRMNAHEVPRNVALLFFSDRPDEIFPGARIDVVQFRDGAGGDVLEERIFRGPLHRQVRDCMSYLGHVVARHVRKHPDRPEATTWETFPLAAVEETVANAVHHRDYQAAYEPTKVYIYPDALEVTSYPGPVPGLEPEDFRPNHRIPQVTRRNRRIGEILKELKLAEVRSTGVSKIFEAMDRNGSQPPRFQFDEGRTYFTVVLPVHPGDEPAEIDANADVKTAPVAADPRSSLEPGRTLLDGRFQLLEHLGQGGLGTAWTAYDRGGGRRLVVVKVLHAQHAVDETVRQRFFQGVRQMAGLDHPSIVQVIEPEGEDGGVYFYVMEHLSGGDLREAVRGGERSPEERLRWVLQVGDALELAHENDIVHGDVKPTNILFDASGRAKLTDFGLVRLTDTTGGTRTEMLGTFLYAAPELTESPRNADARADVYSLAMTAIFVLYGDDLPLGAFRDPAAFIAGLEAREEIRTLLVRAVEWKVEERTGSVRKFCDALRDGLETDA